MSLWLSGASSGGGGGTSSITVGVDGTFSGNGSALTAGQTAFAEIPFAGTITGWFIGADQTGSAVVDVWKVPHASMPATSANSIAGTDLPTISNAIQAIDTTLTGWGNTTINANDVIYFHINSASTVTQLNIVLFVSRTGTGAGTGTVTSVGTSGLLTGGPITTSGTITMANGTANSLVGYNGSGVPAGASVGSGLALSGGTLTATGSGSGTVTSVSVVSANGLAGTVATATTTPAITLSTSATGVLKGNGTAISAATAGTDYQAPISLTTSGTSGAATFTSNVLNIPQYSGGGGGTVYNPITISMPGPRIVANDVTNWYIAPVALTFVEAFVICKTGPTGANLILDIQLSTNNGSTFATLWGSNPSNKPIVTAGQVAGNTTSFDTTSCSAGNILRFDIDQVGSTVAGSDITLCLLTHT